MSVKKSYNFFLLNPYDNNFYFITDNYIVYEIEFKPSNYLFESIEPIATETFELSISIYSKPPFQKSEFDPITGQTIFLIFEDFYNRNHLTVTVHICDTSDGREFARMRKFNYWFEQFNTEIYFKSDIILFSKDGESAPTSIILRRDNPYRHQIIEAFEKLTDGYNQK